MTKKLDAALHPETSKPRRPVTTHYPWQNPSVPPSLESPATRTGAFGSVETYTLPDSARRNSERRKDVTQ